MSFQGKNLIRSDDFVAIFRKYDKDGSGQIEAGELDNFLIDFAKEHQGNESVESLKHQVLGKYDINSDGKINMHELAMLLPTEPSFLTKFRKDNGVTSVDFIKVWNHYDTDKSGYIETKELDGFLRDLLYQKQNLTPAMIDQYRHSILSLFDKNKNGKMGLSELTKLLPLEENFMKKFKPGQLTHIQVDEIFSHYDQDASGTIQKDELLALLKDIVDKGCSHAELEMMMEGLLQAIDCDKDGRLNKAELRMYLSSSYK